MSIAQSLGTAPCRFRGHHPTVSRPASRFPLTSAAARERTAVLCTGSRRGLRAGSRVRRGDAHSRRPASRIAPTRRRS